MSVHTISFREFRLAGKCVSSVLFGLCSPASLTAGFAEHSVAKPLSCGCTQPQHRNTQLHTQCAQFKSELRNNVLNQTSCKRMHVANLCIHATSRYAVLTNDSNPDLTLLVHTFATGNKQMKSNFKDVSDFLSLKC